MDLKRSRIRIVPSLLSADFSRLQEQVAMVEAAGAEMLHLDVMDGHFVPNLSIGVPVIEKLRGCTDLYFDTHVMITDPYTYAEPFIKAGSNNYTFHIEASDAPARLIDHVHGLGAQVGISLNPDTPPQAIRDVVTAVDMVLVMSVWPGFAGQTFIADVLPKASSIRGMLRQDQRLEMDGGIGPGTAGPAAAAGVDTLVAGSAIFGAADPAAALRQIHEEALRAGALRPEP